MPHDLGDKDSDGVKGPHEHHNQRLVGLPKFQARLHVAAWSRWHMVLLVQCLAEFLQVFFSLLNMLCVEVQMSAQ